MTWDHFIYALAVLGLIRTGHRRGGVEVLDYLQGQEFHMPLTVYKVPNARHSFILSICRVLKVPPPDLARAK